METCIRGILPARAGFPLAVFAVGSFPAGPVSRSQVRLVGRRGHLVLIAIETLIVRFG
jgi:hypothetical protein